MKKVLLGLLVALLLFASSLAAAQGTKADYDRAAALPGVTRGKVFRDHVEPHWFDGGKQIWYEVRTGLREHEFVRVDVTSGRREAAFDHQKLAEALTKKKIAGALAERLPIETLEFDPARKYVDLAIGGHWWRCDLASYELKPRSGGAKADGGIAGGLRQWSDTPRASAETGDDTTVTFANRTKGAVKLVWLDPEGKRQPYGQLRAGETYEQHTFAGHVWLVTDADDRPLGGTVAAANDTKVDIESNVAPPSGGGNVPDRGGRTNQSRSKSYRPFRKPNGDLFRQPRLSNSPRSPDGRWEAFVKEHNVYVRDSRGAETRLSDDGTADDDYNGRFCWSPDSKKLLAVRTKHVEERKVYFVESSPRDQIQPKLHSHVYVKPGDPLPRDLPRLFDLEAKKMIPVDAKLFDNPWSIEDYRWAADSSRFTFVYNQRGHQVLRLLSVDAATGKVSPIIDEHSPTFIDYSGKYFLRYLEDSDELIWMSERDGWNHLYLYDAKTGHVKNQITRGPWIVRGVERVDEEKRQIWFRAGGIRPEQDPYYIHSCRVNFDGTGLTVLTAGDGTHKIDFSPDGKTIVDTYSRVDMPPVTELRRADDGSLICELEHGTMDTLVKTGWQMPERFVAKGRDGTTDIYGVIWRPTTFDPKKHYPVIEDIYAGPQDSFVPKRFQSYFRQQSLAELGFIVVQIDGMGTSNRSKKFHDVCWKNLSDAGLPDRILWIRAAATKYPYMDLTRVGIYGGSAGGQNAAAAAMTHGDFYKVAVADCGCHDNRMDKIWWNEQWMGYPVGPEYRANSNVTLAPGLKAKLLLIVGEMDTNVDPASTMQVVDALIRADKDFELLVIPGSNHGAAESPYGQRRRADFLVRNLLGVEPRRVQ